MGKISELELAIRDLRTAAATINDVADTLAEMFSTASTDEAPDAAAPAEPAPTLEQVRAVLADKSRMGCFTSDIRALLQKYGAPKLFGIDPVHYKALVAEAEVLGDGN